MAHISEIELPQDVVMYILSFNEPIEYVPNNIDVYKAIHNKKISA